MVGSGAVGGSGSGGNATGCGVQARDREGDQRQGAVSGATDGVHEGRAALGQIQACRADGHGGGAGEHDIRRNGAGRDVQHALLRVGDPGEDDGATGADIDRGCGGVMPDDEPGLAGGNGRDVVGVRGDGRVAVGVQVGDQRVAVAAGDIGRRGEQRGGCVGGIGRGDRDVVAAGRQIQWSGNGFRLEVVQRECAVDVDVDGQAGMPCTT